MDFKESLKNYQELINKELDKYIIKEQCYEKTLNEAIEYSLISDAKRLRPILILEAYKLFSEDYEKVLPFAVAMEMTHTASLIHDDLPGIDDDDYRRGRLTNHKKYNEATAILAGDLLLTRSYIVMTSQLKENTDIEETRKQIRVINEFANAVDRMLVGEYLDTENEGKKISKKELDYIHNNKTGEFFKYCIRAGAILAGAKESNVEELTLYAKKIGLAFQIKDDILSETGDAKIMGKPVGNDKEKEKSTYVTRFGLEEAEKHLDKVIEEALEILEKYGEKTQFLKELTLYIKKRNK